MNQTDRLSNNGLTRIDTMKARADADFNYEWLYELLWNELKKDTAKTNLQAFEWNAHGRGAWPLLFVPFRSEKYK